MFDSAFDLVFTIFHRGIFATVLTVFATIGLVMAGVPVLADQSPYAPIPEAVVADAIAPEVQNALALGFVEERRVVAQSDETYVELTVGAGECVAIVAGLWGRRHVFSLAVLPAGAEPGNVTFRDDAIAADPRVDGLVASLQWCSASRRDVTLEVLSSPMTPMDPETTIGGQIVLMRASLDTIGSTDALNRGWVLIEEGPADEAAPEPQE